jgi:hypothetical protein
MNRRGHGMKVGVSRGRRQSEPFSLEQLCNIWEKILSDADARRALKRLDEAGFRISHLTPQDASLKHPNWADYIAALPLVPNEPTTRRIHSKTDFRKYLPLVRELREFAANVNAPFVDVGIVSKTDLPDTALRTFPEDLLKTASMLEHFLSWDYSIRHVNPRNALIAELRWTIRYRTGKPHDRELSALIDAAFRAAGYKDGLYLDATTLDRIEKRQRESRQKASQRVRALVGTLSPPISRSTRIHRKSKKRV